MTKRRPSFVLVCLLAYVVLLNSCVVGPQYQRPRVSAPSTFRGQDTATSDSLADLPWWAVFQDPVLQDLIRSAIANNRDLRAAAARVEQAREVAAATHAQYLPQIDYQAGISEGKNESLGSISPGNGSQRATVLGALQATWEADVWGRIRRSNEYALAVYLATEQGRRGVLLSLVSSVAQSYFELLDLDLKLDIARRNVESFQGSLGIFRQRLEGGTASRLETSRAQGALSSVAANIPDLERQIAIQENALRILVSSTPGPITRSAKLLEETVPPQVPAGLPSTLVERRPDILEAEMNVRAANAQIGVAIADFFPRIGLTTLLGRGSTPLAGWSAAKPTSGAPQPLWAAPSTRAVHCKLASARPSLSGSRLAVNTSRLR